MLGYAVAFLLGGYIIPASMHFAGVYAADRRAPDAPSRFESVISALMAAAVWPAVVTRYESN